MTFDVGANARYPDGRGQRLRYRDGERVGPAKFQPLNEWAFGALRVSAAAVGVITFHSAAQCTVELPADVQEVVPDDTPIEHTVMWQGGDPEAAFLAAAERLKPPVP